MVDMLSKFVFIRRVDEINEKSTEEAIISCLKGVKKHIYINDGHGREFCNHKHFGKVLGAKTYFTNPHSHWENKPFMNEVHKRR